MTYLSLQAMASEIETYSEKVRYDGITELDERIEQKDGIRKAKITKVNKVQIRS